MSTFGEIVEPLSRTTWEDWDEDHSDTNFTRLQWNSQSLEILDTIETLFILEGKFLADTIKMQSKDVLKMVNSIPDANLYLYESLNKYICTVKDYNLLLSSEIVDVLRLFILKSINVVTIQTKPMIEYQTANLSTEPLVIRKLTTSTSSDNFWMDFNFPKLEQPNILSGVAAGAVSLREHTNSPATALVYYIEHIEEYQTDEIYKLLEKLSIVKNCNAKFSNILSSNLYI